MILKIVLIFPSTKTNNSQKAKKTKMIQCAWYIPYLRFPSVWSPVLRMLSLHIRGWKTYQHRIRKMSNYGSCQQPVATMAEESWSVLKMYLINHPINHQKSVIFDSSPVMVDSSPVMVGLWRLWHWIFFARTSPWENWGNHPLETSQPVFLGTLVFRDSTKPRRLRRPRLDGGGHDPLVVAVTGS